ncbi:MAG: DUF1858 domain-containing protein [Desulfobacteraceae bacterium]
MIQRKNAYQDRMTLDPRMTVGELMARHPSTIGVFIKRRMLCIGCPAESFHTIEDAALIHGILLKDFMNDLMEAINSENQL